LTNGVIDPYYDYLISEENFNKFIIKKYGSIPYARQTIHSWAQNWQSDKRQITPVQYAALPATHKKYWAPVVISVYNDPSYYVRSDDQTILKSNRTVTISLEDTSSLVVNSEYQGLCVNNSTYVGVIRKITPTRITMDNVWGPITGSEYTEIANAVVDLKSIPADEVSYWTPISIYDFEAAKNALRQNIKLIDSSNVYQIEKEIKRVMS
jgi:hypothetical protein